MKDFLEEYGIPLAILLLASFAVIAVVYGVSKISPSGSGGMRVNFQYAIPMTGQQAGQMVPMMTLESKQSGGCNNCQCSKTYAPTN